MNGIKRRFAFKVFLRILEGETLLLLYASAAANTTISTTITTVLLLMLIIIIVISYSKSYNSEEKTNFVSMFSPCKQNTLPQ